MISSSFRAYLEKEVLIGFFFIQSIVEILIEPETDFLVKGVIQMGPYTMIELEMLESALLLDSMISSYNETQVRPAPTGSIPQAAKVPTKCPATPAKTLNTKPVTLNSKEVKWCKAEFDFEGVQDGDLSFSDGDVFKIIGSTVSTNPLGNNSVFQQGLNWWEAEKDGKTGQIPGNRVQLLPSFLFSFFFNN